MKREGKTIKKEEGEGKEIAPQFRKLEVSLCPVRDRSGATSPPLDRSCRVSLVSTGIMMMMMLTVMMMRMSTDDDDDDDDDALSGARRGRRPRGRVNSGLFVSGPSPPPDDNPQDLTLICKNHP